MAHGSEILRWAYATWQAKQGQSPSAAADPEVEAWYRARRTAKRARRRAIVASSGAAGSAGVALATVQAVPPVAGGIFVLSAWLLSVGAKSARRARRSRPATELPPAPLPSPGSPGYRYVTRLDTAVRAIDQLLGQAEYGAGMGPGEAASVRAAAQAAAGDVREVARRLAAAEGAHRRLGDPTSRAAIDRTISTLTADLNEGVVGLERLVGAASEVVIAASGSGLTGSAAGYLLRDAVQDLETRAAGLRAAHQAVDDPHRIPPGDD